MVFSFFFFVVVVAVFFKNLLRLSRTGSPIALKKKMRERKKKNTNKRQQRNNCTFSSLLVGVIRNQLSALFSYYITNQYFLKECYYPVNNLFKEMLFCDSYDI